MIRSQANGTTIANQICAAVTDMSKIQHVAKQIGGGERRLAVVELGEADLGVGVDEGLLVDPADPQGNRMNLDGIR